MKFDWDISKATSNEIKHGLSVEKAITAFDDPFGLRVTDDKHSSSTEVREWLIGLSDVGVVVVIFTIRGKVIYRIISARKANKRERSLYEINKRISIS